MMQEGAFTPDFVGDTTLHPMALFMVIGLGLLGFALPRRHAMLPIVVLACLVAPAQRIVVLGLDFNLVRVMVLLGWARLALRGELRPFRWVLLDRLVIAWALCGTIAYSLLFHTTTAVVYRLGATFDITGLYFLTRMTVRTWDDVDGLVRAFLYLSVPVACVFIVERITARNLFAMFGGVPPITMVREGRLRCQGAFSTPMLAGCFWASVLPLFAARWWRGGVARYSSLLGLATCSSIVFLCSSATPVMSLVCACIAALLFCVREQMRVLRWAIMLCLCGLHLVMKAPVWHLVCRLDFGGSTGWHRYHLIDNAIRRIGEWWCVGTQSTAHWGGGLEDVTNQYVLEGVHGGIVTLAIFLAIVAVAYRGVGRVWRAMSKSKTLTAFSWSLGVALFVHTMNFIGISYAGQNHVTFIPLLAVIAAMESQLGGRPHATVLAAGDTRPGGSAARLDRKGHLAVGL